MLEELVHAYEAWEHWKVRYNWKHKADDISFQNFKKNHEFIRNHNQEFKNGKHTYSVGHNQFSHMDSKTFSRIFKGLIVHNSHNVSSHTQASSLSASYVPSSIDWRSYGAVNPVQNQGQYGTCYSFSAIASIEGQYFRKTGRLVKLSEQNAIDGSVAYGNQGDNGGNVDIVFTYVKENGGIDSEASYPYRGMTGPCQYNPSDSVTSLSGYVDLPQGNETSLTNAVATIGPISVAIDASQPSFQLYKSGIYNDPRCSSYNLDHAVVVIGYGTENNQDYYIVRNSWGPGWGEEGYIRMARNCNNFAGIATMASYPVIGNNTKNNESDGNNNSSDNLNRCGINANHAQSSFYEQRRF